MGAISPSTGRTLPDRYIEGTCPICGYDGARGDQCDNCGNQLDPIDLINPRSRINGETPEFVETEHFFLDLPALRRGARRLAGRAATDWRPNVLKFSHEPARRPPAAGDHPRPRLGRADPAGGLATTAPTSASTSGSTRSSATCRPRSSGPAAPATPTRGGTGGSPRTAPTPRRTTSWARTTSSSTRRSGRRCCSATTARATSGGKPGALGRAQPAHRGGLQRVPHDGGPQVLLVPRGRHLRPRLPGPLRRRRAALLHRGRRPGDPGHRLHLGRVRPPQQRRAGRRLGQPGQPVGLDGGQELRRDPAGRAS